MQPLDPEAGHWIITWHNFDDVSGSPDFPPIKKVGYSKRIFS